MHHMTRVNPQFDAPKGLARVAASGAAWTTAQTILNKFATLVAMYIIALQLSPEEFGMAVLTLSIVSFLVVLLPLAVSDLMILDQIDISERARLGQRLALRVGVITTIAIVALSPIITSSYSKYSFGVLVGLIMVVSLRPTSEAFAVGPLSRLRVGTRYRAIAIIDGSAQFLATLIMVSLAFLAAGALSLVLPQVIAVTVRAICYRLALRRDKRNFQDQDAIRSGTGMNGLTFRHLLALGSAQYIHNIMFSLPVLVLGYFASDIETGYYGFAFQFASQANGVISCQLGIVLQPLFGKLKDNLARQTSAFLRSVKAISAIIVPVTLLQAALAQPLFALLFKPEWQPAYKIFVALSIVEAFLLRLRRRSLFSRRRRNFARFFLSDNAVYCFACRIFIRGNICRWIRCCSRRSDRVGNQSFNCCLAWDSRGWRYFVVCNHVAYGTLGNSSSIGGSRMAWMAVTRALWKVVGWAYHSS